MQLQILLAETMEGPKESNDKVKSSVDHHRTAWDRSVAEGRQPDGSDQRGLHLKRRPAPERLTGHDQAGDNPYIHGPRAMRERSSLLNPASQKANPCKPSTRTPFVSVENVVPHKKVRFSNKMLSSKIRPEPSSRCRGVAPLRI